MEGRRNEEMGDGSDAVCACVGFKGLFLYGSVPLVWIFGRVATFGISANKKGKWSPLAVYIYPRLTIGTLRSWSGDYSMKCQIGFRLPRFPQCKHARDVHFGMRMISDGWNENVCVEPASCGGFEMRW